MNVKYYVMALLCLYITIQLPINNVHAQALKVGDTLPEELWNMPLQVVNHPEGKETISLSEYKDKLIILDFWATWCGPCLKSLVKLDSLQNKMGARLQVVPITYESPEKAIATFKKRGWNMASVVEDIFLQKYFPHRTIPHQVWVKDGVVLATPDPQHTTLDNINDALNGKQLNVKNREEDMLFDKVSLVQRLENGYIESSIRERVKMENSAFEISPYGIIYYNASLLFLLRESLALINPNARMDNRIIFDLSDTLIAKISPLYKGNSNEEVNTYTYHSRSAFIRTNQQIYSKMREDILYFLHNAFGIAVSFESRKTDCLVLKVADKSKLTYTPTTGTFKYQLANRPFTHFAYVLNWENRKQPLPIIDETGLNSIIEIKLTCELTDIDKVKAELANYGIEMVDERRLTEVIVLKSIKID